MSNKNATTIVAMWQALIRLYQILLEADEKKILAKYQGELEQKEEEAIEKVSYFPNTIIALKNMRLGWNLQPYMVGWCEQT